MMESWAASNEFRTSASIVFLCINVDEPIQEAISYSWNIINQLQLRYCTVGYIESPISFGQLGCSGFIVADPNGTIIMPQSPAFLQYREQAFGWMHKFLTSLPINAVSSTSNVKVSKNSFVSSTSETEEKTTNDNNSLLDMNRSECETFLNELCVTVQKTSIKSMDDDHTECFQLLLKIRSTDLVEKKHAIHALEEFYQHLIEHFEQEEILMDRCQFGGGRNGMGYNGHTNDHNNILSIVSSYIDTVRQMKNSPASSSAHKEWINDKFIIHVAKALHHHIQNYDSLYTNEFHSAGFK
jgi:hemerythrin